MARTAAQLASAAVLSILSFFTPNIHGFLYSNVISVNFPDPSIIQITGTTTNYAFATRNNVTNCPTARTNNFNSRTWQVLNSDCMPTLGPWVVPGNATVQNLWAPDVTYFPESNITDYAIYYSANSKQIGYHCIGIGRSSNPQGPYVDNSKLPLICPPKNYGGAIDPSAFVDADNSRWIVYKVDGAAAGNNSTPLILYQTSADGGTLIGPGTILFNNAGASDEHVVEAPILVNPGAGVYFLFFSSGSTFNTTYTISYATSVNGIRGPYSQRTLLMKGGVSYCGQTFVSPGGMDISLIGGRMAFHQGIGGLQNTRTMNTATLSFNGRTANLIC